MNEPRSRVYRQVVTMEVIGLATKDAPDSSGDLMAGVDVESELRSAITDHDGGGEVWLVPGESSVSPIEELTP